MGICSKRRFLLAVCVLQIVTTALRQVFDFLGYMWVPILANFLNIIFVIFGFFGGYQYRPRYLISYCGWTLLWLAWNVFVVCFYLEIGVLSKDGDALNMGTGSASWWEVNGPGCRASFPANLTGEDVLRPVRPERVLGCVLPYEAVEVVQAGVQAVLGLLGGLTAVWVARAMLEEDDSSLRASKVRAPSLYSIEFSPTERSHTPDRLSLRRPPPPDDEEPRAKPMTPRRVKRRSTSRGSVRGSVRNPVSRLLEAQEARLVGAPERRLVGHSNPTYQSSSVQSLDRPASSYSNYHGQRPLRAAAQVPPSASSLRHSYRRHQAPPPYNGHSRDSETVI